MKIKEQFNRNANSYKKYSIIQQNGAKLLIESLPKILGNILDIGAGNGRIYKELLKQNREFKNFYALDFSNEMLKQHPISDKIKLFSGDFNQSSAILQFKDIDTVISASALQWAFDIKKSFKECSLIAPFGAFFIFTSGTFKTLHSFLGVKSPIYSEFETTEAFLKSYKPIKIEKFNFTLEFNNSLDMLRYIKKSGVTGGGYNLSYRKLKKVIDYYPNKTLEFETLLLVGKNEDRRV